MPDAIGPSYDYKASVVNVVDGDTIDCLTDVGFRVFMTHRFRLLGVDAPEVVGATRAAGLASKRFVADSLLGRQVIIHTEKADAFGRYLCDVFLDGESFNRRLVAEGYAATRAGEARDV